MRRFLATLLLLTLLVGLLAVSASAATGEIQTEAELMEAAQNGGSLLWRRTLPSVSIWRSRRI